MVPAAGPGGRSPAGRWRAKLVTAKFAAAWARPANRRRATSPTPATRARPRRAIGSGPAQNSPVCTVVTPGTAGAVAAAGTTAAVAGVTGAAAVATGGAVPVAVLAAEASWMSIPPSVPVEAAPSPCRASIVSPLAVAEPFPLPDVAEPEPTATAVWSGVPARNVCD